MYSEMTRRSVVCVALEGEKTNKTCRKESGDVETDVEASRGLE